MIVGEPVDHVEGEEPGRGEDPRLVHVAPPRRFRWTRAAAIVSASPARIAPNGAHRPLFRLSATVSTGAASSASGTPSATAAFARRAPSRCDRGARAASSAVSAGVEHGAPAPRVRVLDADDGAGSPISRPRDLGQPVALVDEDVRRRVDRDAVARLREREQRDEVRERARRHEHRRLLAEQLRAAPLELVDVLVLAVGRPAEPRRAHRLPHRVRRSGADVGAQVDHRARQVPARDGRPCARRPRPRGVPFTSTSSTPRDVVDRVVERRAVLEPVEIEHDDVGRASALRAVRGRAGRSARAGIAVILRIASSSDSDFSSPTWRVR